MNTQPLQSQTVMLASVRLTARILLAVVLLVAARAFGDDVVSGSGFFITDDGYFVTNYHVIRDAKSIVIVSVKGKIDGVEVVRVDPANDLAILKVPGRFSALPVVASHIVKRGRSVATLGFPHADIQGTEPKLTDGIVSSLAGIGDDPRYFQISIPLQAGNSGGPLLTREANVVGVIAAKLSADVMLKHTGDVTENVGYAVKSNYLLELVRSSGLRLVFPKPRVKPTDLEQVSSLAERATALVIASVPPAVAPRKTVPVGKVLRDCETCPEMVVVPAGEFTMGSSSGYVIEAPEHQVAIQQPFAMGKTEVTQSQWRAVMGSYSGAFPDCGEDCPADGVSWFDAQSFVQKLSDMTGKQYRLPSEAEWEYACKAGTSHEYCGGDDIDSVAWYKGNSGGRIHPVATKKPNGFGLYDMSGNACEWVFDSWHRGYFGAPADGSPWTGGAEQRVDRGGSYSMTPWTALGRGGIPPQSAWPGISHNGFRVARKLEATDLQ